MTKLEYNRIKHSVNCEGKRFKLKNNKHALNNDIK